MASLKEQGKAKCSLCKTSTLTHHCNTCRINLCLGCVGEHLTSQLTLQHSIVAYDLRDTGIKCPACTSHLNFCCELHCEDCSVPVCSQCCTKTHQGHRVTDITELYKVNEKSIKQDIKFSEKVILPEYEKIIADIKNHILQLQNEYQKLRTSISNQGKKWHLEIDNVISQYQSEIDKMETDNIAMLEKHLSDMIKISHQVNQTSQKITDLLNSNDGDSLINYTSESEEMRKIPARFQFSLPVFTPLAIKNENLYKQFGNVIAPMKSCAEGYTVNMLLDTPKQIRTVNVTCMLSLFDLLRGVTCVSTEQVWISKDVVWISKDVCNAIRLIDVHGSLHKTVLIKSKFGPYDMTVTKQGDLVYTVFGRGERGVYKVSQLKNTEAIIRFQDWSPKGICSTSDGDLLICMTDKDLTESKVVRYSGSTVKQEIMYDDKGQHLYDTDDLFIIESTNKDVWVSDNQAKAVVVTDQSGKFKFRYTGNLESNKYKTFLPRCIDNDSQGHVLVTDRDNGCVHIIDDEGHLLGYIDNLSDPQGLSVDSNDHVWIGEWEGSLKLMKYLMY